MFYVFLSTFALILTVVLVSLSVPFGYILGITIAGQVLIVLMVYKVLKGHFTSDKTFKKYFYQDSNMER